MFPHIDFLPPKKSSILLPSLKREISNKIFIDIILQLWRRLIIKVAFVLKVQGDGNAVQSRKLMNIL